MRLALALLASGVLAGPLFKRGVNHQETSIYDASVVYESAPASMSAAPNSNAGGSENSESCLTTYITVEDGSTVTVTSACGATGAPESGSVPTIVTSPESGPESGAPGSDSTPTIATNPESIPVSTIATSPESSLESGAPESGSVPIIATGSEFSPKSNEASASGSEDGKYQFLLNRSRLILFPRL